jgi:hypothetical protein
MTEITISILGFVLSMIVNIGAISFFFGRLSERVSGIKEDITRLEAEQKEANKVKERTTISEENIKSIWVRIDELRGWKK